MSIDQIIHKWRTKLEALRDERDFLNKHNFRVEAMALDRAVTVLWDVVRDVEDLRDETAVVPNVCPYCGDDRTGKASLLFDGRSFCNDDHFELWHSAVRDKQNEEAS